MNRRNKLNGQIKAFLTVALVLGLTGALVLLAGDKPAAEKGERAFFGVSVRSLDEGEKEDLGLKAGVRVIGVEEESAAAKAGILEKDVLLTVNGESVESPQALVEIIGAMTPGSAVKVGLRRQGKALEVKAVLGKREIPKAFRWKVVPRFKALRPAPYLGVSILDLDGDLAPYFSVKPGEGILVTGVEEGTPAAKAGLKSGDVIVQVGKKTIGKTGDIHEALAELKEGDEVEIAIVRRGKRQAVKAAPDFDRQRKVLRFFRGGRDVDIEHLEAPGMHLEVPEIDIEIPEPPEPPDAPACGKVLREVREEMDGVKVRIEKRLKKIGETDWI